jgi:dTDP-4-amino-4,6-dideoxygalactose transaminase
VNSYGRHSTNWRDAIAVGWQVKNRSLTQGPKIKEFEDRVAEKVGAKFAVAVSSATAGLHIALEALELESDSEVATSPISFVASANAAFYARLKPMFIDIDPNTLNISLNILEAKIQQTPSRFIWQAHPVTWKKYSRSQVNLELELSKMRHMH